MEETQENPSLQSKERKFPKKNWKN
jgi:hypothetical protein